MNKTHRLIWNSLRQTWTVAHEAAATQGKRSRSGPRLGALAAVLAGAVIAQTALAAPPAANALPTNGQVVTGQAVIAQADSTMTIRQASNQAILNWNTFNIGANAAVNFIQPGSNAVALNRVVGTDPSAIYGSLTANGQVFLINPNGVLFGQGARVDVGGLVASTLNIRNEDFLAGNYRFTRDGATAGVTNQGDLLGKYIALLAPEVRNEGVISARQGSVALAAGEAVTLGVAGNALIDVHVEKASIDTLVANQRLVQADDGTVILSARSANALLGRVVNTGAIEARGISSDGGTVRLLASSSIEHSGEINVSAGKVGAGGTAILLASLDNPDSRTTISGSIAAKGGSERGNGGFIETSGSHLSIADTARIDTRAANGKTGTWLLDPEDFIIGTDLSGAALSGLLSTSHITIRTGSLSGAVCLDGPALCGVGSSGGTNGDIIVNDAVTWSAPTELTLLAYRNIEVNNTITASDAASAIYMLFGQEISGVYKTSAAGTITNGAGGDPTVYAPDGTLLTGAQLLASYTSKPTAFVKLDAGQFSTYGSAPTLNYTAYDALDPTTWSVPTQLATGTGSSTWESAPFTALDSTTNAGTTDYLYAGGLPNTSFFFIPAGFESWTVNKATVTLSAATKTYDGTTTLGAGTFTVTGVAGQTLNYSGATASNAHVGGPDGNTGTADNFINLITLADNGAVLASNYLLPTLNVANAPVTITPRTVGLSATKTYDGTTTLGAGTVTLNGVAGESLGYSGATSNNAHVATAGKFINAITLVNNGAVLASDYQLPVLNAANAPVTINPATLLYVADAQTMTSGADLPAFTGNVTGVAPTDTLAGVTVGSAVFSSTATKSDKAGFYAIDGSGLTLLTGSDYVLAQAASNAKALIITSTTTNTNKVQTILQAARDGSCQVWDCDPEKLKDSLKSPPPGQFQTCS